MNKILGIIGAIVVSIILIACPIIMTIAFIWEWNPFIKWILAVIVLAETTSLFACMAAEIED